MTRVDRRWIYRTAIAAIVPALVGAAFGTASSLLVFRYQQSASVESLRTAFAGEIEVILTAVRRPTRTAAEAWEKKIGLKDHNFYYPRAVFDENIGRLGELRDKKLVHDIAYLYATLEQAREEGRRLREATSDSEGMLRYVTYLCTAFGLSIDLIGELTGEPPKVSYGTTEHSRDFNSMALKLDLEFLAKTFAKLRQVALPAESTSPKDTQ